MTDWQTTAKTIFCEAVDDEVTVMVYKDLSVRCTGCQKYTRPNDLTLQVIKAKRSRLKRDFKCEGEGCQRVNEYKTAILNEEAK